MDQPTDPVADSHDEVVAPHSPGESPRRGFLKGMAAVIIGSVIGLIPLVSGFLFFLDPLIRRRTPPGATGDSEGVFFKVARVEDLPEDGTPLNFTVFANRQDAWNFFPNQPIGSVFLRKVASHVIAFNDTCPHLGCKVDHRTTDEKSFFFCPCHTSSFDLDGERLNFIPPRGLDALEVDIRNGEVWVKYQEFLGGTDAKTPVV